MRVRAAWTLARRDLRGGWKNFRLALVGLALGVATIAGVGSFGAGMIDGLRENGRAFPPNFLHQDWRDYLYWDSELESD